MSKLTKKQKRAKLKLDCISTEIDNLNNRIKCAREELGYVEESRLRIKGDIKRLQKRINKLRNKEQKLLPAVGSSCAIAGY